MLIGTSSEGRNLRVFSLAIRLDVPPAASRRLILTEVSELVRRGALKIKLTIRDPITPHYPIVSRNMNHFMNPYSQKLLLRILQ